MDIQTLLVFAAMAAQQGRVQLACDVLKHACEADGFSDYASGVMHRPVSGNTQGASVNAQVSGSGCAQGSEGTGIDGLNSFVNEVSRRSSTSLHVGGVSPSDNTLAPSLHGNDQVAMSHVLAVASSVYMQNRFLCDGDELILDPIIEATAADELEAYDDDALVSVASSAPVLKQGRIKIKL